MKPKNKNKLRNTIGALIKSNRIKKQLTQQDLANLLKVDRQYVWKIENGKINLTVDYLEKIITCLKCKNKEFFNN